MKNNIIFCVFFLLKIIINFVVVLELGVLIFFMFGYWFRKLFIYMIDRRNWIC